MKPSRTDFHRRNFLRASGVAVALPLFESRVQATTDSLEQVSESAAEAPQRMVCVGNPYGMIPDDFFPTESGQNYTLPKLLQPLERHRGDFTVFSNFDHGYTGGHRVVDTFLTGIKTIDARAAVLFGSGMGNGSSHSNKNLPILLAGGGFKHAGHVRLPEEKSKRIPLSNLYVKMLQKFGIETDRFGSSSSVLGDFDSLGNGDRS